MKVHSKNYRVFVLSLFASGVLLGAPMPILDFETSEERARGDRLADAFEGHVTLP